MNELIVLSEMTGYYEIKSPPVPTISFDDLARYGATKTLYVTFVTIVGFRK